MGAYTLLSIFREDFEGHSSLESSSMRIRPLRALQLDLNNQFIYLLIPRIVLRVKLSLFCPCHMAMPTAVTKASTPKTITRVS